MIRIVSHSSQDLGVDLCLEFCVDCRRDQWCIADGLSAQQSLQKPLCSPQWIVTNRLTYKLDDDYQPEADFLECERSRRLSTPLSLRLVHKGPTSNFREQCIAFQS